ncbi:MAG: EAL domain-containing protein [Proteobacteria bacterium]|nr:EAL domain-containing protein [Pseudomonadota bacterium]
MAFQPIVDLTTGEPYAYEALVRGPAGEGAASVLSQVTDETRYAFDQQCRVSAIEWASRLKLAATGARLSINFLPNAVYEPRACIRATLAAAMQYRFPTTAIIFEFTEQEVIDTDHLLNILRSYKAMGFLTAIDDFGAGHSGLGLLAQFQPDIVKLDMALIRGIDSDSVRRSIVGHTLRMLEDIGILAICEGIETKGELRALCDLGLRYAQGYILARPAFEALPAIAGTAVDPIRLSA